MTQHNDAGRGREASKALTEVRTVLSRAETALRMLEGPREAHRLPKPASAPGTADMGEPPEDRTRPRGYDPDITDMRAALEAVVALLSPWAKTGKTAAWCTPVDAPPALDLDAVRERYETLMRVGDQDRTDLRGTAWAFAVALAGGLSAGDVPELLELVAGLTAQLAEARGEVIML